MLQGLLSCLVNIQWVSGFDTVQSCWNDFESKLVGVVDVLVPSVPFINNAVRNHKTPKTIKNKLNLRKRLLRKQRISPNLVPKNRIIQLNVDIKTYYYGLNKKNV